MSFRSSSGGLRRARRARSAVVELTPLIDIVFQLLIFFLLTATFQTNPAFNVNLPKARNRQTSEKSESATVGLSKTGAFEIDGNEVDARELELRLCSAVEAGKIRRVNIKADRETQHGFVVEVMDIAKHCKVEELAIVHGAGTS